MSTNKLEKIGPHEKAYLNIFGDYYEQRGLPRYLGVVYALLAYRANKPEDGLTQQQIADIIDRSVSTASRILNKLVSMKYCEFTEIINDNDRRERKYYLSMNISELATKRFQKLIQENEHLLESLSKLEKKIKRSETEDEISLNQHIKRLESQITSLISSYDAIKKIIKRNLKNL